MPDGLRTAFRNSGYDSYSAGAQQSHASGVDSVPTVPAAAAAAILNAAVTLPERADVLVTDMLDHRCRPAL